VVILGVALAHASVAEAAAGWNVAPYVWVAPGSAASGTFVDVTGGGFRPATMVVAEVCGRPGTPTRAGCALSAVNAVADANGLVRVRVLVEPPEVGCPCAVRLRAPDDRLVVEAALAVDGVPGAVERTIPVASSGEAAILRLVDVTLQPDESWAARLGGPHRATLSWTLEHAGGSPVVDPEVTVRVGAEGAWSGVMPPMRPGPMLPGDRHSSTVSVDLGVLATGTRSVEVSMGSPTEAVVASVNVRPWALWVLAGLVTVEALLFGGRNLLRRRLAVDLRNHAGLTAQMAVSAIVAPPAPPALASDHGRLRALAASALLARQRNPS
jgi:hypothetical protein